MTEAKEYARRALRGESLNYEAVRKRKDGTRVHVSVVSGPMSVADSHISYYVIYRDITERKRAEQRLRESEAYLAEAQRLSQTGIWAWNPATGDSRYWSEIRFCVLGFDPAGPLPRFEEFLQRLHPDDQAASTERFEKAIRDKADFDLDYRIVHPEKGIREVHAVGHAVLDGSGNLGEFVGTVIDATERKRAEQELRQSEEDLRTITDTIRQTIVVLAPDGTILYANRVALDYGGLTLDEVIKEGFLARVCHPDDINRVRDEVEIRYDQRQLRLRVRDDGKGIDREVLEAGGRVGHYGFSSMRERAKLIGGKLQVWSEPDSGTETELTIPGAIAYATSSPARRAVFWRRGA